MAKRAPSALNALIAIDKPVGITSHDVVARLRRALGVRRIGHAGTLDPLASGVMVVGVGQATRLLGQLTLDTKSYLAEIQFGFETTTDDSEGERTRAVAPDPRLLDAAFASRTVASWVGVHQQVPPAYSAISVDGVRSSRRARAGDDFELPAREVEVREAMLLNIDEREEGPCWCACFTVSKGTYIRALARDIARGIGAAAHLGGLRRTASGSVTLSDCLLLDEVTPEGVFARALDPVLAMGIAPLEVTEADCTDILCGRALPCSRVPGADACAEGARIGLVFGGELRALARREGDRVMMGTVFPQGIGGVR